MSAERRVRTRIGLAMSLMSMATPIIATRAQTAANCTVTPSTFGNGRDLCQKATDLFSFVVPQVGVAVAGGNVLLGEGGTLGGWGKRAVSLRILAVDGRLPRNSVPLSVSSSTAVSSDFGAARTPIPMPSVDLGIGFVKGIPLGLTNVGGVDLLVGAMALPSVSQNALRLKPRGGGVAFSYGVRVGALQESTLIPGVSASYMRRRMPTLDFAYTPSDDTLQITNASVTSNSFRLTVSKRVVLFGLALGVGQDQIVGTSGVSAVVNEATAPVGLRRAAVALPSLEDKVTRSTAFVNASLGLIVARIVAEFGWSSAGTVRQTVNTFGGRQANEGYRYGSIGITARF